MATTGKFTVKGLAGILNGDVDLDTDTLKIALVEGTYVPDYTNDEFMDDVTADELNEGNRGAVLINKASQPANVIWTFVALEHDFLSRGKAAH